MSHYHMFSLGKIGIGLVTLLLLYFMINPYEDPVIALSGGLIGFFLLSWGLSFFAFRGRKKYISKEKNETNVIATSYRLSLLFGVYILFNLIFLLQSKRTVLGGITLLIGFILIQWILLPTQSQKK